MYYEINVALHGSHHFATAERSIKSEEKLIAIHAKFVKAGFGTAPYSLSVSRYSLNGGEVDVNEINERHEAGLERRRNHNKS